MLCASTSTIVFTLLMLYVLVIGNLEWLHLLRI